ncbi:MAG TPA: hypothetical protein VHX63_09510 [Acidobacteriaceae bacterium]|jgi:hypothetical protein|nr:hypothetical protein [Acidobacteriaceae bacterium]
MHPFPGMHPFSIDTFRRSYLAAICIEETKFLAWASSGRAEFAPIPISGWLYVGWKRIQPGIPPPAFYNSCLLDDVCSMKFAE